MRSNIFIATGVKATGRYSFKQLILVFLGTGTMTADLSGTYQSGTLHSLNDQLKICVSTGANSAAQCLMVAEDTRSGPAAFLQFCFLSNSLTSSSSMTKGGVGGLTHPGCVRLLVLLLSKRQYYSFRLSGSSGSSSLTREAVLVY